MGEAGAGDALFIKCVDARQLAFGHDHLEKGGATNRPMHINYDESVHIEISLGSLYTQQDGP